MRGRTYEPIAAELRTATGLVVDACLTHATGTAEPEGALAMREALPDAGHKTIGTDRAYDTVAFVANSRARSQRTSDRMGGPNEHPAQRYARPPLIISCIFVHVGAARRATPLEAGQCPACMASPDNAGLKHEPDKLPLRKVGQS